MKKTPAENPAKNPAENPAENPAHSTMKEGPFQYCLSHPDSIDQKGLWQLERILFLPFLSVQQDFFQLNQFPGCVILDSNSHLDEEDEVEVDA